MVVSRCALSSVARDWHGKIRPRDSCPRGLWLALLCFAGAVSVRANDAAADAASAKFLGARSCSSSSCHGGAGNNRNQYTVWSAHDFHHLRPYATLETARSERIAGVLNVGNPAQSRRCTVCHAPFHTLRAGQLDKETSISEGVSCETCHGPSENWLRAHTRPDWSHEDRVRAGMRDLKNLYIRANTCVACHQNVDSDVQQAGHPELIFELDGQAVSQPRHWRQSEEKPGPQIWLVGQAVALREMSWQLAREKSPGQTLVERWAGLFWLVQAAGEVEGHLTGVESNSTARTAEQFDQVQRWSDRFAKEVAALRWSEERTRRCLALLANRQAAFSDRKIPIPLHARRAERLVLALDRLVTGLGDSSGDPTLNRALDRLFDDAQSLPEFDPNQFANNLKEFHASVPGILDSK
ncbi:MAG TPA: multiheme c-type cytochrome [Haliangiales bacterium]|nr:multiheme c-type cytochrome [Haliangiales bacterium]